MADAEQAVARIRGRMDEIRQTAARMTHDASALLGDDAGRMLDQIGAAEQAKLAALQTELSQAEAWAQTTRADRQLREAALAEARARVQSREAELGALAKSSPAAARIVVEAHEVEAAATEAEAPPVEEPSWRLAATAIAYPPAQGGP